MLEGKAVVGDTDMTDKMQVHAMRCASEALDLHDVTDCKDIACYIKKEFDKSYGPGWQCVAGTSFGSYVTHSCGCFIHFCVGRLAVMLFKGAAL
jgi:dynein light chain LC8-type